MKPQYIISWNGRTLEFGKRTRIMGILNVTPDSFSDGGKFYDIDKAVAQGVRLVEDGADILDIGGESTRPFSEPVSAEDEIRRVVPVIEKLVRKVDVPISIDTTKAAVAKRAIAAGAAIINDVGALRLDPDLVDIAARTGVPVIVMHMLGIPKTMQVSPSYGDLIGEIRKFLENAIARAVQGGVARSKVIIDPGIGFGKTLTHNLELIQRMQAFETLGTPILIGPSRKAFIRTLLKDGRSDDLPADSPVVETGTQAVVAASVLHGAHIVRVHNVAETRATVKIIDAVNDYQGFAKK